MSNSPVLVWFRRDLRLEDNPALAAAAETGASIVPVFLWSPEEEHPWEPGAASRWWLHHSLEKLDASLRKRHSRLVIRRCTNSLAELRKLLEETRATSIYWNRLYDPAIIERDTKVKSALAGAGVEVKSFGGYLLYEPPLVQNKQGKPFQVFTPFWKHCSALDEPPAPLPAPRVSSPNNLPESVEIPDLGLLPRTDWAGGLRKAWKPGEEGGSDRLALFAGRIVGGYQDKRNRPDVDGTSRLSPHLHFGELSPRQVWHAVRAAGDQGRTRELRASTWSYLREIGWREFSYHLLYYFPQTPEEPLRDNFRRFPWKRDPEALHAWQRGRTGYPMVDAGMRELWTTGWMHNRVRMIAASFLVKHLLIPWQEGARWFWDTLVDADLANNTMGWQWTAGCGADAAPYFRIFNPITQGEKFDPDGSYVRQWVPEIELIPDRFLFKPWEASGSALTEAQRRQREAYPQPVVDHPEARTRALDAFAQIKKD